MRARTARRVVAGALKSSARKVRDSSVGRTAAAVAVGTILTFAGPKAVHAFSPGHPGYAAEAPVEGRSIGRLSVDSHGKPISVHGGFSQKFGKTGVQAEVGMGKGTPFFRATVARPFKIAGVTLTPGVKTTLKLPKVRIEDNINRKNLDIDCGAILNWRQASLLFDVFGKEVEVIRVSGGYRVAPWCQLMTHYNSKEGSAAGGTLIFNQKKWSAATGFSWKVDQGRPVFRIVFGTGKFYLVVDWEKASKGEEAFQIMFSIKARPKKTPQQIKNIRLRDLASAERVRQGMQRRGK